MLLEKMLAIVPPGPVSLSRTSDRAVTVTASTDALSLHEHPI
jgi:hypothetical protein